MIGTRQPCPSCQRPRVLVECAGCLATSCRRCRGAHVCVGVVYLLHFAAPYRHARHYCGWSSQPRRRLEHHANGSGSRLLQVVAAAGITWVVARTWPGDRHRERQIKRQGGLAARCPICRAAGVRGSTSRVVAPPVARPTEGGSHGQEVAALS